MLNDDNEEGKLYSKVNLTVNSGIIAQINSHLMTFFKDFYGVLVGSHKVKREIRPSDKKAKKRQNRKRNYIFKQKKKNYFHYTINYTHLTL